MVVLFGWLVPDYVWWLLGIAAAVIIYLVIREEQRIQVNKFMKRYGVWILLIGCWFFFKDRWGFWDPSNFFGKKANTLFFIGGILVLLGINFLARERYVSTQAICDNRSGSCAEYEQQGEYIICNIGSCDAPAFPWNNGHETWVVPSEHFDKINQKPNSSRTQIHIKTKVQKVDLVEIPSIAFDFISSEPGYNKDSIYYGEFSIEDLEANQNIIVDDGKDKITFKPVALELRIKDQNRMLNENRTMLKGKLTAVKGFVSDAGVILRKAAGKSAFTVNNPQNSGQGDNQ